MLDHLSEKAAFSREKAHAVYGTDSNVAAKLAAGSVINERYDAEGETLYWLRAKGEPATGASVLAGFVVVLVRNVTTPSGRTENVFLAQARYDGKGTTFRRLLRGWMHRLGLRGKDLLGGTWSAEVIPADSLKGSVVSLRSGHGLPQCLVVGVDLLPPERFLVEAEIVSDIAWLIRIADGRDVIRALMSWPPVGLASTSSISRCNWAGGFFVAWCLDCPATYGSSSVIDLIVTPIIANFPRSSRSTFPRE